MRMLTHSCSLLVKDLYTIFRCMVHYSDDQLVQTKEVDSTSKVEGTIIEEPPYPLKQAAL